MVERIEVAAYGGAQILQIRELASISTPDTETIEISPWDKHVIGELKKAIEAANIGLTPGIDGDLIRIKVPPMTTEDRERLVKIVGQKAEQGRIMIRQVRAEAMKDIKRAFEKKEITEDGKFAQESRLQELVDGAVSRIDEASQAKEKEVMQI